MPEENQTNEIGEPMPANDDVGWSLLAKWTSFAVVLGGGAVAVAVMTTPTHARGATSSNRLKWEQVRRDAAACERVQERESGVVTNPADLTMPSTPDAK
jgi:hypothetical protein